MYGLSVDDGPNDAHCELLDLYKQKNIRASFFYVRLASRIALTGVQIGTNVMTFAAAGQEAHNAGHTICVHVRRFFR